MKLSRSQMKAKLEEAAQELIETLLDWDETNKTPSLREIEDEVLVLRQQFGQILAATVVEGQEAQQPALTPCCPDCGEEMRYKGRKSKKVESRVGALHISRGRYCCPRCESGVFPPGQATWLESEGVE
jgi:DNA repair exonuclease SbcCD ATPase subunit